MVKLSIVIPYYKTFDLTCNLLDALVPQLTEDTELFLVDDGCNETGLDKYADKINITHLEENKGSCVAMNYAIKRAEGEYIAIIDSDDMVTKDYVETLLNILKEHNEDVIFFDWQDMNTGFIVQRPHNYAPWKAIYKKTIMPLFREGWKYSYDVPFQEDLAKTNYSRYYIDKVLYFYNSNRPGNLTLEKAEIIRKRGN
ncbi:MAG: glycosyltransferase family 2 protein [Methanobrevibacter sp.]|nr:glycosyltransferase family 2 protein [Methanobrevibacter sp.]